MTALRSALLCTGLVGLAACGGGGGGGNVRSNEPAIVPSTPNPPPATQPPVVSTPNPAYSAHISLTGADVAHNAGVTGAGVRIGVIDTGVMRTHPALSPRVVANLNYVGAPNNLAVDDVVGHGTAVSQIAAGTPFGAWPGGIAPGAEIVSARIIADEEPKDDGSGQGNEVDGALGLAAIHQDLINRGVRVMNNSWGGLYWTNPAATAPIAAEYRPFIINNNGLVVFATGNEAHANPSSMAALPSQLGPNGTLPAADLERGWLAVTAVNPSNINQLDVGSNGLVYANACGEAMRYCLAAPGTVAVTGKDDKPTSPTYWRWAGTSLSAPQVSGAAALVWQAFPYFNNDLVRQTLLGTARDIGVSGVDPVFGYGLLDAGKAVKGPGRFDWGDVTVNFDGITSTWSNQITGAGGLIKQGTGTLRIDGSLSYTGRTQVLGGTLDLTRSALPSTTLIGAQGRLMLRGGSSYGIENQGRLDVLGTFPVSSYLHGANATLAFNVGDYLNVMGTAQINGGTVQVLGVKSGYVWTAHEPVLKAWTLTGQFNALTAAQGVFLNGSLSYDPTTVWLNITRLDVTAAAQSMGLTTQSVGSAQRVEGAFDEIDAGAGAQGAVGNGFLSGAGAIQGSPTAAAAERTLSSLSGELHSADATFALMAIEGNRRALESRVDEVLDAPAGGAWYDQLTAQRAMSQFDLDASGWVVGQDRRHGERLTLGAALSQTDAYAYHDQRYDRERNRQLEAQFYAAYDLGAAYLLGSLSMGNMQRWTQRDVLLGEEAFRVRTDYADRYASANLQAGIPFHVGNGRLTPYAGMQSLRLERNGFSEDGAVGFGLSTSDSSMTVNQALLGARYATGWRTGSTHWDLQARLEWQRLLSQSGGDIEARFTALDVWSPILGNGIDRDVGVFGFGLGTWLRGGSRLGFDLDARHDQGETWSRAMVNWSKNW
ncbi:S8 family serine peptidase [Lysobacter sp. LF1]|uniref:S8 family serine peptidase n=1 Tax=Lysobacter stagni TaxID=3045172 RepID=A0ABT6XH97_9GAMM|nr:autotransporter serine protease [Lysobacter sp. LF1]MDI9239535.1 S8 family serine peptidase [Lysobacter sp. LF1]